MDKNAAQKAVVMGLKMSARGGWGTFMRDLQNRLGRGADPVELSVLAWRAKVALLKEGHLKIPVGTSGCPLCMSHREGRHGKPDCDECEYTKYYGVPCDVHDAAYTRFQEEMTEAEEKGEGVTNGLIFRAQVMLGNLQRMQDAREPERKTNMKTKLAYTPISGDPLGTVEVGHMPDLQEGFYRLEGATASIRVTHGADLDDLYAAVRDKCPAPIALFAVKVNLSPNTVMRILAEIAKYNRMDAIRIVQGCLPEGKDISLANAKRIVADLVAAW